MIDFLLNLGLWLWLAGTIYGFLYPLVVAVAVGTCAAIWRQFRPRTLQCLALAAPGAAYWGLGRIRDRQAWNQLFVVTGLIVCMVVAVFVSAAFRRPSLLTWASLVAVVVVVLLWVIVPSQSFGTEIW